MPGAKESRQDCNSYRIWPKSVLCYIKLTKMPLFCCGRFGLAFNLSTSFLVIRKQRNKRSWIFLVSRIAQPVAAMSPRVNNALCLCLFSWNRWILGNILPPSAWEACEKRGKGSISNRHQHTGIHISTYPFSSGVSSDYTITGADSRGRRLGVPITTAFLKICQWKRTDTSRSGCKIIPSQFWAWIDAPC